MDELDLYNGTHTGQEIDAAVEKALYPRTTDPVGSADDFTDSTLASIAIVAMSLNQEIVQVIVPLNNLNGSTTSFWTFPTPSPAPATQISITAQHVPIMVEFSDPSVICGDYSIETGNNIITFSGAGVGSTDMTITLAKRLGDEIDKR